MNTRSTAFGCVVALALICAPQAPAETFQAGGRSYVVEQTTIPAMSPPGQAPQAICPDGERVLSGGMSNSAGFEDMWILSSRPAQSSGSSGYHKWVVDYQTFNNATSIDIKGYAICDGQKPAVVEKSFVAGPSGLTSKKAKCPADRHVVGGGGSIFLNNGYLLGSRPFDGKDSDSAPDDGWKVTYDNLQAEELDADAFALCAKAKPAYREFTSDSIAAGQQGSARASCPASGKKKFLVGGGHSTPAQTITSRINASNPFLDFNDQAPSRSWIAYMDVRFGSPVTLTAHAICAKKA